MGEVQKDLIKSLLFISIAKLPSHYNVRYNVTNATDTHYYVDKCTWVITWLIYYTIDITTGITNKSHYENSFLIPIAINIELIQGNLVSFCRMFRLIAEVRM